MATASRKVVAADCVGLELGLRPRGVSRRNSIALADNAVGADRLAG